MFLGSGGFGNVYLGKLSDRTEVAVKKMENWGQGEHEFFSEVSIIGTIHHLNLLQFRGYCAENRHRLLVYEYMANGSLDEWLFENSKEKTPPREPLQWATRMQIALGIARGLAYLHEECQVHILHLDIKPENILLDIEFVPRISDFGFSKVLIEKKSCMVSFAMGTPGYMAPDWLVESIVSSKSDVYSFGIVLLEIVGGRRNHDASKEGKEDAFYPCWAMKKIMEGKARDVIDERIRDSCDVKEAETLVKVGLCCIQKYSDLRPGMRDVVHMLEGLLPLPSSQSLSSMIHVNPCVPTEGVKGISLR